MRKRTTYAAVWHSHSGAAALRIGRATLFTVADARADLRSQSASRCGVIETSARKVASASKRLGEAPRSRRRPRVASRGRSHETVRHVDRRSRIPLRGLGPRGLPTPHPKSTAGLPSLSGTAKGVGLPDPAPKSTAGLPSSLLKRYARGSPTPHPNRPQASFTRRGSPRLPSLPPSVFVSRALLALSAVKSPFALGQPCDQLPQANHLSPRRRY